MNPKLREELIEGIMAEVDTTAPYALDDEERVKVRNRVAEQVDEFIGRRISGIAYWSLMDVGITPVPKSQ